MTAEGDRPIPVRSVVPAAAPESAASRDASASDPAPPPSQPPRILETGQGRWEVRPIGQTRTGHGHDAGALLLLVRFDPLEGGEGETKRPRALQPREGLGVARSLEDLDDEALEQLLERARPVS